MLIRKMMWIGLLLLAHGTFANVTKSYRLPNGLKLIVRVDQRAPVAVCEIWYKVGGSYEHHGITGISHVLEHMMFRGTKKFPSGQLEKIITANGGEFNAFTSQDYTAYYEYLSADKLPLCFELESDRMRNLLLSQKDFIKEIQVVMEERRLRTDDNPQGVTAERFNAAAFIANPYHHPVVGWMKDLENLTVEKVRKWYETWYAPNNAIIVVAGDVNPDEVERLALRYFGPLKSEKIPQALADDMVKPLGERRLVVNVPAKLPWLIMGYNVPVVQSANQRWEPYALVVIAGILDGGDSARLPRDLVRGKQVATSVEVSYDPFSRLNNLFTITGTPTKADQLDTLRQNILNQIKQLQEHLVSSQELKRIKAQVIAGRIYSKDSVVNQANEIGMLEAVGLSWKLGENFANKIDAITPKQIQAVARNFLIRNRLTIATLRPLPLSQEKPSSSRALSPQILSKVLS